ncbi:MAG: hypothetical protein QOK31_468 [Solirubrobacteraceae bacterium]|jgi:hypothetical protein|nr:hypothetical protein [Solirubrobacteraceae bacterium]
MLNPLGIILAVIGRIATLTKPRRRPLPDPRGRQGAQPS